MIYQYFYSSYSNWAAEEPQTAECVQLWKASFWMWDDTYCDEERYFICEDQGELLNRHKFSFFERRLTLKQYKNLVFKTFCFNAGA